MRTERKWRRECCVATWLPPLPPSCSILGKFAACSACHMSSHCLVAEHRGDIGVPLPKNNRYGTWQGTQEKTNCLLNGWMA